MIAILKHRLWGRRLEILEHMLATSAAVVSRASMLVVTLINTRYLPPSEFGLFAVLMLIGNIISAFVSCGGDMWLNRFTRFRHANAKRSPIVSRFYLQISMGLAAMVVICAVCFATFWKEAFEGQGKTICLGLIWAACAGVIETILAIVRTTNNIQRFFIFRDFLMPIVLVSSIVILKIQTALAFYLTACIIWGSTLAILFGFLFQNAHLYLPNSLLTWAFLRKGLLGHTLGLIFNNFLARFVNGFDTLILARLLPLDIVGRYRFGAHFANAFTVVQHFAFLALPWHFRQSDHQEINRQGERAVSMRQTMLLLTASPVLALLIIGIRPLLNLVGQNYQTMAVPFCVLLMIRFSELLWGPQHEILISNSKVLFDSLANMIAMVLGIILFFALMPFLGCVKAAIIYAGMSSIVGQWARFHFIKKLKIGMINDTPWVPIVCTLLSLVSLILMGSDV